MNRKEYKLGKYEILYLINEQQNTSLLLFLECMKENIIESWEKPSAVFDTRADYMRNWQMGSLAYFYVEEEQMERPGLTMKGQGLASKLKYKEQYNANIGIGVDGDDSGSEALRQHLMAVRDFFIEIKREMPDLIIENCASGGHRLEPSMLGVSAMSSFSDAHEAIEIPYIAANLHNLILPAQSLIWAVLHDDEPLERTIYSLVAGFLGRICLSGQIDTLRSEQRVILKDALSYYKKLEHIIKNGETKIYGNRGKNTRYPTGTQVVIRMAEDEAMVVCHAFDEPADDIVVDLPRDYSITDSFYGDKIEVKNKMLIIRKMHARTAQSVILKEVR